jgi:hypothetical protein
MNRASEGALRRAEWKQYYKYFGVRMVVTYFECPDHPGIIMSHAKFADKPRVDIEYLTADGRSTDSLATAAKRRNKGIK